MTILRDMTDDELLALAGDARYDLSALTDGELEQIIAGTVSDGVRAKIRPLPAVAGGYAAESE
jgi:hypothetical protein